MLYHVSEGDTLQYCRQSLISEARYHCGFVVKLVLFRNRRGLLKGEAALDNRQ